MGGAILRNQFFLLVLDCVCNFIKQYIFHNHFSNRPLCVPDNSDMDVDDDDGDDDTERYLSQIVTIS